MGVAAVERFKIGLNVWTFGHNETEKPAAIKFWPLVEVSM